MYSERTDIQLMQFIVTNIPIPVFVVLGLRLTQRYKRRGSRARTNALPVLLQMVKYEGKQRYPLQQKPGSLKTG